MLDSSRGHSSHQLQGPEGEGIFRSKRTPSLHLRSNLEPHAGQMGRGESGDKDTFYNAMYNLRPLAACG